MAELYFYWKFILLSLASFPYFKYQILKIRDTMGIIIGIINIYKKQQQRQQQQHTHTYSYNRHCVLCNRINILDPLYLCTGMKCIQKDASMNQKCQHYLLCTSIHVIAIIIAASFVNENYLVLCLSRTHFLWDEMAL